ncbi:MAG: dephospho-CoA kinase [Alphaproteobacteria bacterium]|nr:dephospho-CoA kinase [Alphaproteobacteria bacterium]
MIVIGLTGSIGMGKTTVSRHFQRSGVPVFDADAAVHALFAPGGEGVAPVLAAFPGLARDGGIDRAALGRRVFGDTAALARLEAIVHPLVRRREAAFLACVRRRRRAVAVLDIPLLFETGGEKRCDLVVVVDAPPFVQGARVLRRPEMTRARLRDILARQMPATAKRRRADAVIPTGRGRRVSLLAVRALLRGLGARGARRRRR